MDFYGKDWQKRSVFRNLFYNSQLDYRKSQQNLEASCKDSVDYVQRLGLLCKLSVHQGCVNSINWNANANYLLSGSDDQHIAITDPYTQRLLFKYRTSHNMNIFSARFMPHSGDKAVVSCSGDGIVLHSEFLAPYALGRNTLNNIQQNTRFGRDSSPLHRVDQDVRENYFTCHKMGSAYDVLTLPHEPRCFMSCGEDGTVRFFDLRCISRCNQRMCNRNICIACPSACNALDLAPINTNLLAVGCCDSIVRLYDRRQLTVIESSDRRLGQISYQTPMLRSYPIPLPQNRLYRTTSVKFSPDERQLLVNYSSDYLYLYNLEHQGFDAIKLLASGRYLSKMPRSTDVNTLGPRLRLRGDWSDTGPMARPENETHERVDLGQVRPPLQPNVMGRIAEVITRMLSDPQIRMNLFDTPDRENLNPSAPAPVPVGPESTFTGVVPPANPISPMRRVSASSGVWRRALMQTLENLAVGGVRAAVGSEDTNGDVLADQMTTDVETSLTRSGIGSTASDTPSTSGNTSARSIGPEEDDSYVDMKFVGHRNSRTMIKSACFWGNDYVMSGSDCGHIFVWNRYTGELVKLLEADRHVVNRVLPHPHLPYLASSGIDYDIKLWAPNSSETTFDMAEAETLIRRNAVMLQQTMDTITVPAPVMVRLLAGLHSLRNRNRR